ncbi:hypothetical protein LIER_16593 [Lithospermum erythrorhizon]|uniref:Uncharacterized protein n=1 Tax=Lithospermum erythrorhizon TaxID=34254 RepID=A0AAV3Q7A2_LITER
MAELLAFFWTPLMLFLRLQPSSWRQQSPLRSQLSPLTTSPMNFLTIRPLSSQTTFCQQNQLSPWGLSAGVTSNTKVVKTFIVNSAVERNDILLGSGGGKGNFGSTGGKGGGGGDNSDSGNNNDRKGPDGSGDEKGNNKNQAMSMSQKFTLGYALLVGMGGVAGYLKSGSQKSLIAGGASAYYVYSQLPAYYVYSQLPTNPVFASSVSLGCSAALLGVMGSRFKKSGKVFPAGVVSFVSFIMTGGYLHGIMRSSH